jgi:hypothetical protein
MTGSARAASLAVILGMTAMIGSEPMSGKRAAEQANPDAPADDPYWTPERLRAAKPIELPHPSTPPPEATPVPEGAAPSISGAGSPGSGGIAPAGENMLDPEPDEATDP